MFKAKFFNYIKKNKINYMFKNCLVPLKKTIDYRVKPRIIQNNSGIDSQGLKYGINPFCEISLEESLRMKEKGWIKSITAVTIGDDTSI